MIGWSIIAALGAILIFIAFKYFNDDYHDGLFFIMIGIGIFMLIIAIGVITLGSIEYHNWETSFNLLKNYIENKNTYTLDSIKRVIDIAEVNKELFQWQAGRLNWGIFSMAPKSVLSLAPIV